MSKMAKLIKQLGADAELLEAYKKDAKSIMEAAGLSADEMKAIQTGDVETIEKETGLSNLKKYHHVIMAYK